MIWNNNCRSVRRSLALWAGNDLEEREQAEVERHLAVCPRCREVRGGLDESQRAVEQARLASGAIADAAVRPGSSVWPSVARHLPVIDDQSVAAGWRHWLPTGALAAACLAVILALVPELQQGAGLAENDAAAMFDAAPAAFNQGAGRFRAVSLGQRRVSERDAAARGDQPVDPDTFRNF